MNPAYFKKLTLLMLVAALTANGCARAPKKIATPTVASVRTPTTATHGFFHTLEPGQTLYRIAKNYQVDVNELMRINRITDPSHLEIGTKIFIPTAETPSTARMAIEPYKLENIRYVIGPKNKRSDWRTITVHHSGTNRGSAKLFDKDHRRRKMGGLFYHFVIGNGSYTSDGLLEVGWRWKKQVKANRPYDIQICLVGNFNQQEVSPAQFGTLAHLIRQLQKDYSISTRNIRRHDDIKGKNTECPGKHFPFHQLVNTLNESA